MRAEADDPVAAVRAEAKKAAEDEFATGFYQGYSDLKRRVWTIRNRICLPTQESTLTTGRLRPRLKEGGPQSRLVPGWQEFMMPIERPKRSGDRRLRRPRLAVTLRRSCRSWMMSRLPDYIRNSLYGFL